MREYTIILKNEKVHQYNIISWVFILFNIVAAIWVAVNKRETGLTIILYVLLPTLLVLFLQYRFDRSSASKSIPAFRFPALFMIIPWISLKMYWVAGAVLLFSILHSIATRKLLVEIDTNKLVYPSYPKKQLSWSELKQVMLKDGLLTIDLKNNKLIQQEIDESLQKIDQKEFNDFCNKHLGLSADV